MRRIALLLATTALIVPAPAAADDICVSGPDVAAPAGTCEATIAGFAEAVAEADTRPGFDRVKIGAGTVHYSGVPADPGGDEDDDVEIVGAGRDATVLEVGGSQAAQLLFATDPGTVVRDLEVRFTSSDEDLIGLELGDGLVERVDVTGLPGYLSQGLLLHGGDLRDVRADLEPAAGVWPVVVDGDTGDPTTIEGLSATGEIALFIRTPRPVTVHRAQLVGIDAGLLVMGAADVVADTFTASGAAIGSYGTPVLIKEDEMTPSYEQDVTLRHGTLYLGAGPTNIGVRQIGDGHRTDLHLRGMALYPPTSGIHLTPGGPGSAINVDSEHSSLDPDAVHAELSHGATTSYTPGPGTAPAADPRFVAPDSGDFRIEAGSDFVDLGEPTDAIVGASALDLLRGPRVVDGDGDGDARRDIGAFEYDPGAPPVVPGDEEEVEKKETPPPPPPGSDPPPLPPPPGGSQGPPVRLAPLPAMTLSATGALDRRRRTALTLGCPASAAGPCTGEVVLRAAGVRLGRAPFSVAAGRKKTVRVTITRLGLRTLRRARALRVRAALTARNASPSTALFTLRRRR